MTAAGTPARRPVFAAGRTFAFHGRAHRALLAAPYAYPRGYPYRRWTVGQTLPGVLLSPLWIIEDIAVLGLPAPEGSDLEWVRYGPDALLVDTATGQIVDVAYGVFVDDPQDGPPPEEGDPGRPLPPNAPAVGAPAQGAPVYPPPPLDPGAA